MIPLVTTKTSTCDIKQCTDKANLILHAKLIIWDEAPMLNKICAEAVDRTFRDIMRTIDEANLHKPFGGKVVVFGGDFRKILPVVRKCCRHDIVASSINSSELWKYCKNMNNLKYYEEREILAQTHDTGDWFTLEFLNDMKCSRIPNHRLKLKIGVPVMLLRNIDQAKWIM
ncbi:uncharacterized protein [Cicer arietinum]|uniref:uncharacterized protein n=1 Tax=Cicer arietinum TaxID=3827 RepID=UPI003CC5211F